MDMAQSTDEQWFVHVPFPLVMGNLRVKFGFEMALDPTIISSEKSLGLRVSVPRVGETGVSIDLLN